MKRIQLFEFEDLDWFPDWIRASMTRMITVVHGWLGTSGYIADLLADMMDRSGRQHIVDLCSGDGGPMPDVWLKLHHDFGRKDVRITLTDLYPNQAAAHRIGESGREQLRYLTEAVDAQGPLPVNEPCIRTLVCSFHHMPPPVARQILNNAISARDPILIYEISDNSVPPKYLWWVGLPLNLLFGWVVAACTRPFTMRHFFFSFVVPVIPLCFAWDGAVSNARTYTAADLSSLLDGFESEDYVWTTKRVEAKPASHLCLLGMPAADASS